MKNQECNDGAMMKAKAKKSKYCRRKEPEEQDLVVLGIRSRKEQAEETRMG